MMSGRFYIDGKDAFTEYGIYVQEGGYNELVAYPPLKAVTSNDWQEEDGIEPDLSEPTLNTKEFSLKIVLSGKDYCGEALLNCYQIKPIIHLISGK